MTTYDKHQVPQVRQELSKSARGKGEVSRPTKTALVLAGGGITGGVYQLGVLRALDDLLLNRSTLDFDIYVGTSAGAFVATLLSIGIPAKALVDMARNPSLALQWSLVRHVFSPNFGELGQRLRQLPRHVPAMAQDLIKHRGSFLISDILGFLSLALPSGLLDSSEVGAFMREILELAEMPVDFAEIEKELYVVACRLDTWERMVFSAETRPKVSIPDAVAASSAIPIVFKPVRIDGVDYIDGGVKGAAAVDVAIDKGAGLVIIINALAPLDVRGVKDSTFLHRFGSSIADLGIKGVANQVARGILKDTLTDHVRLLRLRHPEVDIVVIEPLPNDEKMFFHEVMSTSARLVVAQHGYESVLDGMTRNHAHFSSVMARHGIEISPAILDARPWRVPLESIDTGEMPDRIQQTVFGGPRAKTSKRVTRLVKALEKVESERQLPIAKRPAAAAPAPGRRSRSAGTPTSTRSRSRRPQPS
jgi:predicted acylesterase/phospholipase RssA